MLPDGVVCFRPTQMSMNLKISSQESIMCKTFLLVTGFITLLGVARAEATKTLDIYFIDVEGGQATLFVSPSGESMLIDTGNPGDRDASRIVAVAKQAGLTQI